MPYCVKENGNLLLDTTYEHELLSKIHYLSFNSGDYDESEFHMGPNKLDANKEFENYPLAVTVKVSVSEITH